MANITIRETDLTTAGSSSVTENVVYIPGYAKMGPIGEPTECSTLSEFESIFGTSPYKFKNSNSYNGISYSAGDYEKSYYYAAELLKAGLPIVFERIETSNIDYTYSTIKLREKYLTYSNTLNSITYNNLPVTDESKGDSYVYSIEVPGISGRYVQGSIELNLSGLIIQESISDSDLTYTITNSEITVESFEIESDKITITLSQVLSEISTASIQFDLIQAFTYGVSGKYNIDTNTYDFTLIAEEGQIEGTATYNNNTVNINITSPFIINEDVMPTLQAIGDEYEIILKSKYAGNYSAEGLTIAASTITGNDNINYIQLIGTLTINNTQSSEPSLISFNELDSRYYKNISNPLFDIESTTVPETLYNLNLLELQTVSSEPFTYLDSSNYDSNLDEFTVEDMYNALNESILNKLEDKSEYSIKFITTGSYPIYGQAINDRLALTQKILTVAGNRGDVIALVDAADEAPLRIYEMVNDDLTITLATTLGEDAKKYGAMFTPWAKYQLQTTSDIISLPASFGYLKCVATSTKSNANWFAVSGVSRGQVPNLIELNQKVTGAVAETLQARTGISINPITNIKPYGYCVWGNRTLFNNLEDLTASSFLNIRMLTSDVKKVVYTAAKKLTFELNSETLWLNFKAEIEPTLDQMKSGNGLSNYKITKVATTKKATLACVIRLYAIEAVEDWDIEVQLTDSTIDIQ